MEFHWLVSSSSFKERFPMNVPDSFYCLIPQTGKGTIALESVYIPKRVESVRVATVCLDVLPHNTLLEGNLSVRGIKSVILPKSKSKEHSESFSRLHYLPMDCSNKDSIHVSLVDEGGNLLKMVNDAFMLFHIRMESL